MAHDPGTFVNVHDPAYNCSVHQNRQDLKNNHDTFHNNYHHHRHLLMTNEFCKNNEKKQKKRVNNDKIFAIVMLNYLLGISKQRPDGVLGDLGAVCVRGKNTSPPLL